MQIQILSLRPTLLCLMLCLLSPLVAVATETQTPTQESQQPSTSDTEGEALAQTAEEGEEVVRFQDEGLHQAFSQKSYEAPSEWGLCVFQREDLSDIPEDPSAPYRISADSARLGDKGLNILEGNVAAERGFLRLEADRAEFSRQDRILHAKGNIYYQDTQFRISADRADVQMEQKLGRFEELDFEYSPRHAYGHADVLEKVQPNKTTLEQLTYSTCDPHDEDWVLKARHMTLDHDSQNGIARKVKLYFQGVPIFYTPYMRFPIGSDRLSGFLFPEIYINNRHNTYDLAVPYYWNIAPNYDLITTPHLITKRGLMLENRFRYLTRKSKGSLTFEYLDEDSLNGLEKRGLVKYQHNTFFTPRWYTFLDINRISDFDYIADMGHSFTFSRKTHIPRRAQFGYLGTDWHLNSLFEEQQPIYSDSRPLYKQLPRINLNFVDRRQRNRPNLIFESEYAYFDSDVYPSIGGRSDLYTGVYVPFSSTAAFLTPKVAYRMTQYNVELYDQPKNYDREIPLYSLDSGLFFERLTFVGDSNFLQTLEPRLYYLKVPYVEQHELPLFDTGLNAFTANSLFAENRFTGKDRIGDTEQLTLALTSRYIDNDSGKERLRASLGQIRYLADWRVQRSGTALTEKEKSDYAADLVTSFSDYWSYRVALLWNPITEETTSASTRLSYYRDRRHIFNLAYREQARFDAATSYYNRRLLDISNAWQIHPRWQFFGRYYYDLDLEHYRDVLVGLGYESCCWATRFAFRSEFQDRDNNPATLERDPGIVIEVELKGLSSIGGKKTESLLKHAILGY